MNILIVIKVLATLLCIITGGFSNEPILFESEESKTNEREVVFNSVSLISSNSLDTWKMKQSHYGEDYPMDKWDEIMIKVYKKSKPYKVSYHQIIKGKEVDFKVSCFSCHPNGPRVIRPSVNTKLGFLQKVDIFKMNLLIKSYGKTVVVNNTQISRQVPFKLKLKENKVLDIKTCNSCHGEGKIRSALSKHHLGTIEHLVREGHMPPRFHKLSVKERNKLNEFIHGF